eukprot:403482-Karenia_brevis.AAC.2
MRFQRQLGSGLAVSRADASSLTCVVMHTCTVCDLPPCRALPLSSCFGRPTGWRFSVEESNPNWKRDLARHCEQHELHRDQSALLCERADMMRYLDDGSWQCQACQAVLRTVGKAANH